MRDLNEELKEKYEKLGENSETYKKGLLHAKPITYWDYIDVDALLALQKPRTDFKDEEIFVMYHQVTELFLKMMVHELKQLIEVDAEESVWLDKLERLKRYTLMLINSFDVMKYGMNYDDYNTFRSTLTPASGFQSAQFRFIEIYCTKLENLINTSGTARLKPNPSVEDYFEQIYWKDAGTNRETGEKSLTLRLFEGKYLEDLIVLAKKMQGNTLQEKAAAIKNPSLELTEKLKEFDYLYNVAWPLVHLETAQHYLDSRGAAKAKAATGGSEWKKYLHPKYQQRKFFPNLLTEQELANWGEKKASK
jgi:tryptophan 2,3-dioxygenase